MFVNVSYYKMYTATITKLLWTMCVFLHCCLGFFEVPMTFSFGWMVGNERFWAVCFSNFIEIFFIIVYIFHIFAKWRFIVYEDLKKDPKLYAMYLVLTIMIIDLGVSFLIPEYEFKYSRFLRPYFIIYRFKCMFGLVRLT